MTNSGTIGESSKDGEKEGGFRLDAEGNVKSVGLVVMGTAVGEALENNGVLEEPGGEGTGGVAGFGAIERCLEDGGWGVGLRDDGGVDVSGECGIISAVRIGSVSAKSTIVLKESLNMSQAISVRNPVPAAMIIRVIMNDIFNKVLPA